MEELHLSLNRSVGLTGDEQADEERWLTEVTALAPAAHCAPAAGWATHTPSLFAYEHSSRSGTARVSRGALVPPRCAAATRGRQAKSTGSLCQTQRLLRCGRKRSVGLCAAVVGVDSEVDGARQFVAAR